MIENIRGLYVNGTNKVEIKEKEPDNKIYIDRDIKYNIVIVSNQNISEKQKQTNTSTIKKRLDKNKVGVFILTDIHPNKHYSQPMPEEKVFRKEDFVKLRQEIKRGAK